MKRPTIRFVSLWAIVLSTSLNVQAQFAGGTGEPDDPYLIATAEQFLAVDLAWPPSYFRLCNDIDLDRQAFPLRSWPGLRGHGWRIGRCGASEEGYWARIYEGCPQEVGARFVGRVLCPYDVDDLISTPSSILSLASQRRDFDVAEVDLVAF